MELRFTVIGRLNGLNDYISAERTNKYKAAAMKRSAQRKVMISMGRVKPLNAPVEIIYRYYEKNRRRDKDNVAAFAHKVIQDALVQKKVIGNDGWRYVAGWQDIFDVDTKKPRIEITVREI